MAMMRKVLIMDYHLLRTKQTYDINSRVLLTLNHCEPLSEPGSSRGTLSQGIGRGGAKPLAGHCTGV
jgi:hypothetical protein